MKVTALILISLAALSHANTFDKLVKELAKEEVGAYWCNGAYSTLCHNSESCCESKDEAGKFTCCPSTHVCGSNGACEPKATENVGAYWCNGAYSTLCHNSESCCESKDKDGKFTCCPSTHTCGANGTCEPKVKQIVGAYQCESKPFSTICSNTESCCESKVNSGEFTCCPSTHVCGSNGACEPKVKELVGAFQCESKPFSKICKNSESCCKSKDNSGEFTCCPSTHTCGSNGACEPKVKEFVGAFQCEPKPFSKICKNSESCCQSKDKSGEFTCCPSTHVCGSNGACEPKAKENVGAYWCNGAYSTLCHNSESCCESKDKDGKFTCCPSTHMCGANGTCEPKTVGRAAGHYQCMSVFCQNDEKCCQSKTDPKAFSCCAPGKDCSSDRYCV